jgi:hypothetical protein
MNIGKLFLIFTGFLFLSSCIQEYIVNSDDNASENFELLWKTVDENYCFFEEKGIDWNIIKKEYEPLVSENTSEEELFRICSSMLSKLKDGHVNLYSDFNTFRYWNWFLDYPQNFNWALVERNYLGKDYIIAGRLKAKNIKSVGYCRYESFDHNITYSNVKEAIKQLGNIKGLIIDIRDNGGGSMAMVSEFSSCFFSKKTVSGYVKYKNGPGHKDFSELFPQYIKPDSSVVFDGKIIILTNRLVYSAANDFVSIMKTLPNVTVIGDVTGGGGGAPFSSELYNGWKLRVSRDPLFNTKKESIENGIMPDIMVDMNQEEEADGVDSMIEFALNYINGN